MTFDAAVIAAVRQVSAKAGLPAESLASLVVGASFDSLRNARMLRHVPGGRYWRDVLATSLEFGLPVPASVHTAIELAATAEAAARAKVLIGAGDFLLIRAQRHVEAGLFRNGSLRHEEFAVLDGAIDPLLIERLADLAEPLLRAGRPQPVVIWGTTTSNDRLLRHDLSAELRIRGLDVPRFRPSSAGIDAVLTGGLLLAMAQVRRRARTVDRSLPC
ncbi:hypothetical protein [Actinoplanes solisilvae]|uniref:hypothetical protein n=1 Tax=Actinoplanes solisilvae TaxID=2486853 RepID=UPI000FD8F329|nr:hypothetical protein [Actinoplanes solisilvae]